MSEFLPFMHLRNYGKNEVVFFRGDPSQALYIVKKGIISLNIDIEDQFEELMKVKTASFFGDNSLLPDKHRIYHAVCVTESAQIYVIPRLNIVEVFESNLKIKSKMMTAMADYYNGYTSQLFTSYRESFGFFDLNKSVSPEEPVKSTIFLHFQQKTHCVNSIGIICHFWELRLPKRQTIRIIFHCGKLRIGFCLPMSLISFGVALQIRILHNKVQKLEKPVARFLSAINSHCPRCFTLFTK